VSGIALLNDGPGGQGSYFVLTVGERWKVSFSKKALRNLSLKIHEYTECAYHEYRSSHLLSTFMEDVGFLVERGVGNVKTAFSATYSQGEGPAVSFNAVKYVSSD
jgi:hypothetical protein